MKLRVTVPALRESFRISSRYDRERRGLGSDFLDEFARTVAIVGRQLDAHPNPPKTARRWQLRRFPYAIMYVLENRVLYVLAIGHVGRGPRYWNAKSKVSRR